MMKHLRFTIADCRLQKRALASNRKSEKYKILVLFVLLAACAFVLSGCHAATAKEDPSKIHVGIVFDIGGKDDRSFNAAAWQGVQRAAKDLPIVLRDIEPGTPNAIEPAMRAFAERNFDLIIGVGFAQAPIMEAVAKDYPNIHFAIIDGVSELPNGCGVSVRLLGRTSKTVRAALTDSWQAIRLALLGAPTPDLRKG